MGYAVGIDLGTTNSVVSIYRRGVVETIAVDGRSTMPSVVSFRDNGAPLVGQAAKSRLLLDPEHTFASVKRFMGNHKQCFHVGQRSLSPVDISGLVLKRLVEGACAGLGEEVRDAVITVPAYFDEAQREDTKRAGEAAGLNVLRLLPEPTAAAVAYGLDKGRDQTIMVYDLGGGTFDVSILTVQGNRFEVKAVGGDSFLGGDDFDQAIVTWAASHFQQQTGIDLLSQRTREAQAALQRLKEAAETAKKELAQAERADLSLPDCLGHPLQLELTLANYNALIMPFLERTVACMRAALRDASMRADDIDRVILVGGSTKNRAVREIVAREIKDPYISERVDEVVSHGAAIMAANLFLPDVDMVPIEVTNVTAHSLGTDALSEVNGVETVVFCPLILRQTTYPCRRGMIGTTNRAFQDEVELGVFRGEHPNPKHNMKLGELALPVHPPQANAVPIGAIFELDADGIIHFTAVQLPLDQNLETLLDYAALHDGDLDLPAVDTLIRSGAARTKTVKIKSQ